MLGKAGAPDVMSKAAQHARCWKIVGWLLWLPATAALEVGTAANRKEARRWSLPTDVTAPTLATATLDGDRDPAVAPEPVPAKRVGNVRLGDAQLREIYSVSCLKARQLDPRYPCKEFEKVPAEVLKEIGRPEKVATLDMGNFPNWRDSRCHSDGEFLCDPDGLLQLSGRHAVASRLENFREQTWVTCTRLDRLGSKGDKPDARAFDLAVVVLGDWPTSESDPATLHKFGLLVMAQWGLVPIYNGVDARNYVTRVFSRRQYTANCPNAATLIVLPALGEVVLSSPSCEFICAERGGPQVRGAMEVALKQGRPLGEVIELGIEAVAEVLRASASHPLSMAEPGLTEQRRLERENQRWPEQLVRSDAYWVGVQRVILLGTIAFFAFALGAFAVYNFSAKPLTLRKAG